MGLNGAEGLVAKRGRLLRNGSSSEVFLLDTGLMIIASGMCAVIIKEAGKVPDELLSLPSVSFAMDKSEKVYMCDPGAELGYWFVSGKR